MSDGRKSWLRAVSVGSSIPVTFVASVMGGFYVGRYLDRFLGTQPWLQLVFMFAGMGLGGTYFVYALKALRTTDDEK